MKKRIGKKQWQKRLTFLLVITGLGLTGERLLCATEYPITNTMTATTLTQPVTIDGTTVTLTTADILSLSGGSMNVNGDGTPYSALLGTGTGAVAGFDWGTGGSINTNTDVTLSIDTLSATTVNLTKNGSGTLNLTATGDQYLNLTQNAGTITTSGGLNTTNQISFQSGALTVNGNVTAGNGITMAAGNFNVSGEYINNGTQSTVSGTMTVQSATFNNGGLHVNSDGTFISTDAANFTPGSAIITHGIFTVGDNSQFDATTVSNTASMTFGTGAVFTGILGNAGDINALGTATFYHLSNQAGTIDVADEATFTGELYMTGGTITTEQDAQFDDIVSVTTGAAINVKGNATLTSSLTVDGGTFTVGENGNFNTVDTEQGTLSVLGNITADGSFSVTNGSTLELSNKLQGTDLGNVTATSINLGSDTNIQTDLSSLSTIRTPTLLVHTTVDGSTDNFTIDGQTTTTTEVASMFGTNTVLRQIYAVDNNTGYDIYGAAQSAHDYAQNEGLSQPAIEAGTAIDNAQNGITPNDPIYDMIDDFYNQTDKNVVNNTLYNLANGYGIENIFALSLVQLGQAGSPFFMGRPTGIPQKDDPCCQCLAGRIDGLQPLHRYEFWGAPFYQSISSQGNTWQHGFNAHQAGVLVGVRRQYTCQTSAGILFAYSAPRLNQSGELLGYNDSFDSRLKLDDYQFAAHLEHRFDNEFRLSVFAGGGAQRLKLNRNAMGIAANQTVMNRNYQGNTDGNTLSVTAYLSRPFQVNDRLILTPVAGIDSEHLWLYSFDETTTGTGNWQEMTNLSEGNFYSPVQYSKTQYDRNMARVGFWGEYELDRGGLSFQAFYGTQLGGEDYAIVPVSTMDGTFNNRIYGYGIGRDSLNLGGGGWYYLNADQSMTASVNYNYFTLARAEVSNVTAALSWKY